MAKLTTLDNLTYFASKLEEIYATQDDLDELSSTVEGLITTGGEPNVIESISVNGTALEVTDENVDITVPTAVSELTNDSGYATTTDVATAISEAGHASISVVEALPDAADAESNVMYFLMNDSTGYYDIYVLVDGSLVLIDDTSVDLTDYVTSSSLTSTLDSYYTEDEVDSTLESYVLTSSIEEITETEIDAIFTTSEE